MYSQKYHNIDLSKFSFLVTGGAGFIGSNLVEYLLKYGAKRVRTIGGFACSNTLANPSANVRTPAISPALSKRLIKYFNFIAKGTVGAEESIIVPGRIATYARYSS